ncbi:MAG: class I SAM-dependent methyltransferase [bacterium]
MRLLHWIVQAVRNPRELSTIFPSSRFLARKIADQLDLDQPRLIAELGPGDGALTGEIVDRMDPESRLFLIEINDFFSRQLQKMYGNHQKSAAIKVLNRSADELDQICAEEGIEGLDYVVSGLPLTTLPDSLAMSILRTVRDSLKPTGRYVQFQYSLDYKEKIESVFGPVQLHRVWRNIFPARVYVADKANCPAPSD